MTNPTSATEPSAQTQVPARGRAASQDFPSDRFDDLPATTARRGAHRAENPRLRLRSVVMWSAVATVALILIGMFGTMLATGRLNLAPGPAQTQGQEPVAPEIDTSYPVLVLNATDEAGLDAVIAEKVIAAGWAEGDVEAGNASSNDFAVTTVYYPRQSDEAAARGLADAIGGAEVSLDDTYAVVSDPSTPSVDGEQGAQLVVVVGLDMRTQ